MHFFNRTVGIGSNEHCLFLDERISSVISSVETGEKLERVSRLCIEELWLRIEESSNELETEDIDDRIFVTLDEK